tara:strand:- start:1313 stop:2476 length:1164 start_codon:yes stop_codon:yes gene_type:complete
MKKLLLILLCLPIIGFGQDSSNNDSTFDPFSYVFFNEDSKNSIRSENGLNKIYDTSGNLRDKFYKKNGKLDGIREFYYSDGKTVHIIAHYVEGNLHGEYKEWSITANTWRIIDNYKNGKKHGICTSYFIGRSKRGEIASKKRYEYGEPVSDEPIYLQKGYYHEEEAILTIKRYQSEDVLMGYPTASTLNKDAIEYYNKATNTIVSDTSLAISYYLKAIKKEPQYVQAYDNIAKIYRGLKKYDLAIKFLKTSIDIMPNGDVAHSNLAVIYNLQGNHNDAISEYKKTIEIAPYSPEGYYGLAATYLHYTKEFDLALVNSKKALELYKKNPPNYIGDSYAQVGLTYYYLENDFKAKEYIQIAKQKYLENNLEHVFEYVIPLEIIIQLSIK